MFEPIGVVRSVSDGIAIIEVFPDFAEGLYRIEELREVQVLFLFDRSEGYDLKVHPQGDVRNPLVGVFASRSPRRPNPIGSTVVILRKVSGNMLEVEGLDAWEGTPVLDIKPEGRSARVKTN
jgi:tRNA (adenine37-N6)-methyltransferase